MGSSPCKILWIILKMDKEGIQTKNLKDKENYVYAQSLASKRCASRKRGGRGQASIEDNVDTSIQGFEVYIYLKDL